jgi:hypothetical protein
MLYNNNQNQRNIVLYTGIEGAKKINDALKGEYRRGVIDSFLRKLNKLYLKQKISPREFTQLEKLAKSDDAENIVLCNEILKSKNLNVVL